MSAMFNLENPMAWVVGGVVIAGVVWALWRRAGPEARERRRRDRSHGRVVSRRHGPSVRLAVDIKKAKKDR